MDAAKKRKETNKQKNVKEKRNDAGSWQKLSPLNPGAGETLAG